MSERQWYQNRWGNLLFCESLLKMRYERSIKEDMDLSSSRVEDVWIIPSILMSLQCSELDVIYCWFTVWSPECQMSVLTSQSYWKWKFAGVACFAPLGSLNALKWRSIRFIFRTEHCNEFILTSELSYCDQVTLQTSVSQYDSFLCKIFLQAVSWPARCILGDYMYWCLLLDSLLIVVRFMLFSTAA